MRFDQLTIPAFGPFSDFTLNLPSSKYDVHLIYGANEAGKSSLLRSIRHLFYGIPSRTTDNFLHPNAKLLIGATVSQGDEGLSFYRKKGTKNTLLDQDQNTLPDGALSPFLGAVNEEFFEHMFGLDTASLRAGAAKLLSGEGDLGSAIFSASLGGSPIDDAIKSLEAEANSLCKGNSRKDTTILPAIGIFKDAERAAKNESTTPTAWRFLKTEIQSSKEAFDTKDRLLREHRIRWAFVDSALRAIPVLQVIRELEAQLKELAAPELPSDFPARVRQLQSDLARSSQALLLHESQIEKTQEGLETIPDFARVLACASDLDTLHRRAERYHEERDALPVLQSRIVTLRDQIGGVTDLEKFPPVQPADLALVKDSAGALEELQSRLTAVERSIENLDIELKAHRAQLAKLSAAEGLDDLEEQCRSLDSFAVEYQSLAALEKRRDLFLGEQKQLIRRLEITGDPIEMKVAGSKIIQEEERERLRIVEQIREHENRLSDVRNELSGERASLSHLVSQAEIYSLSDLHQSRGERDALWEEICKTKTIDEELGEAIKTADTVADALREDADHIAKAAGHQAKIAVLEARQKNLNSDLQNSQKSLDDWTAAWESRYAVHPGQTPGELLEWRDDWEKLCEILKQVAGLDVEISGIREKEKSLLEEIGGTDIVKIHRTLKSSLKKAHQEQGEWSTIEKLVAKNEIKREQLSGELVDLCAKLDAARKTWSTACAATGLSADLPPSAALETLSERARIREGILKLRELEQAMDSQKQFVESFERLLGETAKALEATPSQPVLQGLYEQAIRDQNRALTLQSQLESLRENLPALQLESEGHLAALVALQEQAGSENLEMVIMQAEQRTSLATRLQEQKSTLVNLAGATSVSDFVAELEEVDIGALTDEKATLDEQEDQLQSERDLAKAELDGHLRREAELMQASDRAASHQQEAADALSTIVADTIRFRQLHYAIQFLKQQVEDFRQKTQGPMIEKTSRFFHQLTGGSFEKVAAQLDEKGVPQLIAIRVGGEAVRTTGLSEGTADQLYLALRLAAIDLHLENHPAIPLILDDLLMTFDDSRTACLLPVLKELSQKTQILIFTHHAHMKGLVGPDVAIHSLSNG